MKKAIPCLLLVVTLTAMSLTGCSMSEQRLRQRAAELCQYIPDHELLEASKDYMTDDFYAVLDTMFYRLPQHEAMDHEWLYYFVTGNGGTIADYTVTEVQQLDATHAMATIQVRQKREDGSFDENTDIEKIAPSYRQADICIPTLMMVYETDSCVWGDFWVFWYQLAGDTLKTVSGGNHSGLMTLSWQDNKPLVTSFEQVEDGARFTPSAKRIFAEHFDVYQNMHANENVREAVRQEQLSDFIRQNNLSARYYQDYGFPAIEINDK